MSLIWYQHHSYGWLEVLGAISGYKTSLKRVGKASIMHETQIKVKKWHHSGKLAFKKEKCANPTEPRYKRVA